MCILKPRPHFSILIVLCCLFSFSINPSMSEPRATQAALICSNRTSSPADRQIFISNFLEAMDAISPPIAAQKYSVVVNGTGNDTVYAFGECMEDLDTNDCNMCFAQIKTVILRCFPFQLATRGGRLFFDGCYIRYEDYNFFNETLSPQDRTICAAQNISGLNHVVFRDNAMELVRNLSVQAVKNNGFFAGFVGKHNVTVHGLAQCWEVVNGTGCKECLVNAATMIGSCLPREEGRVLNAGCYMRYSTQKFYNNSGGSSTGGNGGRGHLAVILAVTSSGVALGLIIAAGGFLMKKKLDKKRRERKQLGPLLANVKKSNLSFSYETLEKATNFFNGSNKLGQGGSGSVYKGILPDGKIVAIKRLFFNTQQWVDHFFNEVNLISGIHHKNLVKLLGCSITGPESLLVYEYVPNQSLHDYLFVRRDVRPLSWRERCKIILGTAEGLMYLHEESSLRIIHRDIKLSNILLDDDFTAKIADFGLARLFPEDKSHISTAIAGTLGYMAPEYIVRGKLTEKADIYSFGVLMIEVITRKRNNAFSENSNSILQMVWNLYGSNRLWEAVDPILCGDFDEDEASRLLQIGLLCVQASFELRPPMSAVVNMLSGDVGISQFPRPSQPPYMNPGGAETSRNVPRPVAYIPQPDQASYSHSSGNSVTQSSVEPR